jgi:hypothetical protein
MEAISSDFSQIQIMNEIDLMLEILNEDLSVNKRNNITIFCQ